MSARPIVPILAALAFLASLCASAPSLAAWENHAPLTALALESYSPDGRSLDAVQVAAETLEAFLEAEREGLVDLLDSIEAAARAELSYYPKRPDALRFSSSGTAGELRRSFLEALRIQPALPLGLFLQPLPWAPPAADGKADGSADGKADGSAAEALPVEAADLLKGRLPQGRLQGIAPGDLVPASAVYGAASDESDYGMDIGLFEDSRTEEGRRYAFGAQAFGNPSLSYGTQAPFHMAFPRESWIIKLAAPFTQRSLVAYRVLAFDELSRYAFRTGHGYWGWRFAGWALHYLQDMVQPYHASLIPGKSALGILALNIFGSAADRQAALIFLSNRHTLVEDYQYRVIAAYRGPAADQGGLYRALRTGEGSAELPPWKKNYAYDVVAKRSASRGAALDSAVSSTFPKKYVADPSYDYGLQNTDPDREYDPYSELRARDSAGVERFEAILAPSFADIGRITRLYAERALGAGRQDGPASGSGSR